MPPPPPPCSQTIFFICLAAPLRRCELPLLAECWTNSVGSLYQSLHWVFLYMTPQFRHFLPPRFSMWRSWWKDCALLLYMYILNMKLKPAFLGFLKWMPVLNGPVQSKSTVKELIIGLKRFYDDLWLLYTFIQPRTYIGLCRCKIFLRCVIFKMQVRKVLYTKKQKSRRAVLFSNLLFLLSEKM